MRFIRGPDVVHLRVNVHTKRKKVFLSHRVDKLQPRATILFPMEMNQTAWQIRTENEWAIIAISGRIDSFNFQAFKDQFHQLIQSGKTHLAVDLAQAKFLGLPTIKFLADAAQDLQRSGGHFALLAASEKLKRQIHIYASLNPMRLVRNLNELR